MTDTIQSIGEQALVARLRARVPQAAPDVLLGIGDDAAVIQPERGSVQVITTDALVENVHFRRAWSAPAAIGHKALAVNLSDLAAMGARPHVALLSLALPPDFPLVEFDGLLDGFLALAASEGVTLVGGNMTRSPGPVVIDVTAIGYAHRRRVIRRAGARRGDELYVTGTLGGAAAGLAILQAGLPRVDLPATALDAIARYERPSARTRYGRIVGRTAAAVAGIDLSDGLADGARRLARESGLGIEVNLTTLPVDEGAVWWANQSGTSSPALALGGGEDYELAFVVRPRDRRKFLAAVRRAGPLPVTHVGTFIDEPGEWVVADGARRPLVGGFEHFSASF